MELISVIVPIYNVDIYLKKCIDSILAQTYANLEIILIDDGSTDGCGVICDEYGKRDSRIRVIHKRNGGLSDARNAGMEIAHGRFFGFVDGDDYIAPAMFERLYACIKEDGTDMAVCMAHYVDIYGNELYMKKAVCPDGHSVMTGRGAAEFLGNYGSLWFSTAWNKLYKAELFADLRFPLGKICEDEFIAHRVLWACHTVSYLPERLYYYVCREKSIMTGGYSPRRLDGVEAMLDRVSFGFAENDWYLVCTPYKKALSLLAAGRSHLDGNSAEGMERYHQLKADAKKYSMKILFGKSGFKTKAAAFLLLFNINYYEWKAKTDMKASV